MKTLLMLIAFLLPYSVNSQKLSKKEAKALKKHRTKVASTLERGRPAVSMDTLFSDAKPYALMDEIYKGLTWKDYSFKTFDGKEIAVIRLESMPNPAKPESQTYYRSILFMESGKRAECRTWDYELFQALIDNEVIKNNALNPAGEKRLLMLFPPTLSTRTISAPVPPPLPTTSTIDYQPVERNRSKSFFINGGDINQDFEVVGTYRVTKEAAQGTIIQTYSFYLPNGTLVARATGKGVQAQSWAVVTMKDNRMHRVTTSILEEVKGIAKYLTAYYYL